MFNKTKEKIAAVQAIPEQLKFILTMTITALIVAMLALSMTLVGSHRAN